LPGIKPHRVDTLSNILAGGTSIELALREGPVSTNAAFMTARHREIFANENVAEHDIRRHKAQLIEIASKSENRRNAIRDILNAKWRFSPSRPIFIEYRALTGKASKYSTLFWEPRAPGHERPDSQIGNFFGVTDMTKIEIVGEHAIAVMAERDQDDASDRVADLTKLPGDPDPTPDERAAFIDAALKFFEALCRCPDVPGPKWWTQPVDDSKLVLLAPLGRRFHVWHRVHGEWKHVWYFADADIFTDHEFNRIEVSAEVRLEAERVAGAASAGTAAAE
jgi:hypothetical protein